MKDKKTRVVVNKKTWRTCDIENQMELLTTRPDDLNPFIKTKLSGYKAQDVKKGLYDPVKFIESSAVIVLLTDCETKCFYCREPVILLYEYVREPRQWTLDRIDNSFGHNADNVQISCLSCNLRRKTMYHERYVFTKQLNVVKQGEPTV